MENITLYFKDHYVEISAVIMAALHLFSAIASLTATKKDDKIVEKIKTFFSRFLSIK